MTYAHHKELQQQFAYPSTFIMLFVSIAGAMPAAHMSIFGHRLWYTFSYRINKVIGLAAALVPNSTTYSAATNNRYSADRRADSSMGVFYGGFRDLNTALMRYSCRNASLIKRC